MLYDIFLFFLGLGALALLAQVLLHTVPDAVGAVVSWAVRRFSAPSTRP